MLAQMFSSDWVHCDPHPGSVLSCAHPSKPTQLQLVILNFGLHISISKEMRRQWVSIFKAMLVGDHAEVESVVRDLAWTTSSPPSRSCVPSGSRARAPGCPYSRRSRPATTSAARRRRLRCGTSSSTRTACPRYSRSSRTRRFGELSLPRYMQYSSSL
ncbi:uncharacterized protein SCHCODRAFT_02326661 [Schizophyllum commune H4-8]|uniref:uncharacterized protein n=1 Tax=Schizophyllum commune (strain H4-8 / FGSC 9210) TaxID=578458 RepID=UPI00215F7E93|nr:uncharacterized protein SCHCODRAFT_02326661 [Schizophyllum commune H4-8]KAI5891700.1 hypothetical protein SCHCODRAFT_02326661 [Schizophyllum commune H4-8]